jgi:hypothetical protein
MNPNQDALPVPPFLAAEFYLWLWWRSEEQGGVFDFGEPVGRIDLWMDDRLAFRRPGDKKVTAVMTGENPAEALEAKAALYGGKVLQEVRIRIKRDDRDFVVTLKGPELYLTRVSLPQALAEGEGEAVLDRIYLLDELTFMIRALFTTFSEERVQTSWVTEVEPALRRWVEAAPAASG